MSGDGYGTRSTGPPIGERVRGFVSLTRPTNAVAAGAFTAIGAVVAGGLTSAPVRSSAAVGATVLAVGAGNAINDYFDRAIDRINAPDRPIPSGRVTPREGLAFSAVLFAGAVGLALSLPVVALAIAVCNLLALVGYTQLFKGLPGVGNALVAYLSGSTFLFGAAATSGIDGAVLVLFALAALATFARELIKDVEDLAGDREEGLRTLPIVAGERASLVLATAVVVLAVLASPLPYLQGSLGMAYLIVLAPADGLLLAGVYGAFDDPGVGQARLKAGMFLAAGAFIAGRFFLTI